MDEGTTYEDLKRIIFSDEILRYHCQGIISSSLICDIHLREGNFVVLFWSGKNTCLGHWTALFLNGGLYEYFDPLGENFSTKKDFLKSLLYEHSVI